MRCLRAPMLSDEQRPDCCQAPQAALMGSELVCAPLLVLYGLRPEERGDAGHASSCRLSCLARSGAALPHVAAAAEAGVGERL